MSSFKKVADSTLFVSEPNPSWFGNSPNEELPTWTNGNWLKSRFHFSFAEYKGSKNDNFGCLRVMNDDLVQPARGFGKHPHREMEIVTYIVEGSLTHQDSIGTKETLGKGSIQFMTAGTGVSHSEHNLDPKNPLRFIQMWIVPKERGLSPNYGGMHGSEVEKDRQDKWAHIVSDVKHPGPVPVKINQDCNMWVTELGAGKTLDLELKSGLINQLVKINQALGNTPLRLTDTRGVPRGRQAYLLQVEGSSDVKGEEVQEAMARHDAGEIIGPAKLSFTAGVFGKSKFGNSQRPGNVYGPAPPRLSSHQRRAAPPTPPKNPPPGGGSEGAHMLYVEMAGKGSDSRFR